MVKKPLTSQRQVVCVTDKLVLNLIAALKREGLTLVGPKGIDPKAAVKAALIETFKHHPVKLKAKT